MKSIYSIFALFAVLLLASCAKDEDKLYLKSADSNQLLASTDAVVLTEATSKLYALSLAWTDQTLQISHPQYKPTTDVTTKVQVSLSEDFSGTVLESAVNGLSQSYTVSALNVVAYQLGATVDQSQPVYFRLAASTGSNLDPAYSNTVKVAVTPYFIDFHYANILLKPDMNDSGKDFYSPDANGEYSGFLGASSWMGIYVQEADGSVWHTAQDSNGDGITFGITTEVTEAENGWDMWFPGMSGCYFVNVNTEKKFWNALLLPELTLTGIEGATAEYSRGDGQWKAYFTGTKDEELTLRISGTGKLYDQSSGTDDTQAKDVKFAFGGTAEKLTFATGDEAVPAEIKVTVPADGECTLVIDLNNPAECTVSVVGGGAVAPAYPSYVEMQGVGNMDGAGKLAILQGSKDDNEQPTGIYQGIYQLTKGWDNFKIVDPDNNIWYGCDNNGAALVDGGGNMWFETEKGTYIMDANLANKTWGCTQIDQINVLGDFNGWDTGKDLMTFDAANNVWTATCDIQNIGWGFYFLLNNVAAGIEWKWALKGEPDALYLSGTDGGGNIVPAEPGIYKITLNISAMTCTMEKQ